jgi:hypothetical protein
MTKKDTNVVLEEFPTPEYLYCVAGFEFPPDITYMDTVKETGITYYKIRRVYYSNNPDHNSVEVTDYNFACVVRDKINMERILKDKKSLIPPGACEMLFEDGYDNKQ